MRAWSSPILPRAKAELTWWYFSSSERAKPSEPQLRGRLPADAVSGAHLGQHGGRGEVRPA
jgi:hypothetical protein